MLFDYTDIELFFADPQATLRREIVAGLHDQGIELIHEFDNFEDLRETLINAVQADILVVDADLPGMDLASFVHDLRHNKIGGNPFLPVIATSWHPGQGEVRGFALAGVDSIVAKPLSSAAIIEKIDAITGNRKPFIVTSDYIGPDRRRDELRLKADKGSGPRMINVPNSLEMKVQGTYSPTALADAIRLANNDINNGKLEGHAHSIAMLVKVIIPALKGEEEWGEREDKQVSRLLGISSDIARRLKNSDFEHIGDLCAQLHRLIHRLSNSEELPDDRDLLLMEKLSMALLKATRPDAREADLAASITSSVANYRQFQRS